MKLNTVLLGLIVAVPAAMQAQERCDFSRVPGVVWWGTEPSMPMARLAAYLAPVLWFSPDEPSLNRASGSAIRTPEAFPGQPVPDRPVLYYQMDRLLQRPGNQGSAVTRSAAGPEQSVLDLRKAAVFMMTYFAYFPTEEGLGAHPHDIEPVEFRATVIPHDWSGFARWIPGGARCAQPTYVIAVTRVTGKAHGLVWFWNVLEVDENSRFPLSILVEEGKHALATDKNSDGIFTPGYDVNVRINDAWGVRDIISTGMLFSGRFESWMAKTRRSEHRVLPPLPDDSPLRHDLANRPSDGPNVIYELRPYPPAGSAGDDHALAHLLDEKSVPNWPAEESIRDIGAWTHALEAGAVLRSLSIAVQYDGDVGVAWAFPFFVVKHLEDPMTGGYILQRMYYSRANSRLRHFGWTAMYTPSASRWLDTYISAGADWAQSSDSAGTVSTRTAFVLETGLKFRVNVTHTPIKMLSFFTDYWGLRIGIRNRGFPEIRTLTYVLEFGAGSF